MFGGKIVDSQYNLHKLTQSEDSNVRAIVASALGDLFPQFPDKTPVWDDLHRLIIDDDIVVRGLAAFALGQAFPHVPDKAQVWQDMQKLTKDKNKTVRMYAYHSLGRASVYKATEAKDRTTLKIELEAAIGYFEKSSQESPQYDYSPARFCYPFYRTYFAITFQGAKEDEVQRYLTEAKKAVDGSESNEELIKVVENLANALKESQYLKERPIQEIVSELNAYMWYCEKAAEHMISAEDKAPRAVKLMRICNPLLEERIQGIIAEIQETARQICKITHKSGGEYEVLGTEISNDAKALSSLDLISIHRSSTRMIKQLKELAERLSGGETDVVWEVIEEAEQEAELPDKLNKIELAMSQMRPLLEEHQSPLVDIVILTALPEEY
ncbi:MAG: hypothetical protein WB392_00130, partial [Methanotrichaceae archaeon]